MVHAIGSVRDRDGRAPADVFEFLLGLLKNNDNSLNAVSMHVRSAPCHSQFLVF
jgi:hypothetical protein